MLNSRVYSDPVTPFLNDSVFKASPCFCFCSPEPGTVLVEDLQLEASTCMVGADLSRLPAMKVDPSSF